MVPTLKTQCQTQATSPTQRKTKKRVHQVDVISKFKVSITQMLHFNRVKILIVFRFSSLATFLEFILLIFRKNCIKVKNVSLFIIKRIVIRGLKIFLNFLYVFLNSLI